MTYQYKCSKCKKVEVIDIPMGDDLPKTLECPNCKESTMKHDFLSQINSQTIKIPYWFKATNERNNGGVTYTKDATSDLM